MSPHPYTHKNYRQLSDSGCEQGEHHLIKEHTNGLHSNQNSEDIHTNSIIQIIKINFEL